MSFNFNFLPIEVKMAVISFMPLDTQQQLSKTNHFYNAVIKNQALTKDRRYHQTVELSPDDERIRKFLTLSVSTSPYDIEIRNSTGINNTDVIRVISQVYGETLDGNAKIYLSDESHLNLKLKWGNLENGTENNRVIITKDDIDDIDDAKPDIKVLETFIIESDTGLCKIKGFDTNGRLLYKLKKDSLGRKQGRYIEFLKNGNVRIGHYQDDQAVGLWIVENSNTGEVLYKTNLRPAIGLSYVNQDELSSSDSESDEGR